MEDKINSLTSTLHVIKLSVCWTPDRTRHVIITRMMKNVYKYFVQCALYYTVSNFTVQCSTSTVHMLIKNILNYSQDQILNTTTN